MNTLDNFSSWPGIGKDRWIKYRHNRTYDTPYPESEMDVRLSLSSPTTLVPLDIAAENVARDIYATYPNLFLALSGGVNSEFVANTFLRLGIPFTPLIFKVDALNEPDVWWATNWCTNNGLTPLLVEETAKSLMTRVVMTSKATCSGLGLTLAVMSFLYKITNQNGGKLVTGSGLPEHITSQGYVFKESDILHATLFPIGPWNFLSWTPEIMLSYIASSDITKTHENNKIDLFRCSPRPSYTGIHEYYFENYPLAPNWNALRKDIGTIDYADLGTKDQLVSLLLNT